MRDAVRRRRVQRGHRHPVVAVLSVVVVLDNQAAAARPGDELSPPVRGSARRRSGTGARASPAATSLPRTADSSSHAQARARPPRSRPGASPSARPDRGRRASRDPPRRCPMTPRRTSDWARSPSACATPATTTIEPAIGADARGCGRASRRAPPAAAGCRAGRRSPGRRRSRESSTARSARSQSDRGNADRSGTPGDRSMRAGRRLPRAAGVAVARCGRPTGNRLRKRDVWPAARVGGAVHHRAAAGARVGQPLVMQPLVGLHDDATGDREVAGERAARRQGRAGARGGRRRSPCAPVRQPVGEPVRRGGGGVELQEVGAA